MDENGRSRVKLPRPNKRTEIRGKRKKCDCGRQLVIPVKLESYYYSSEHGSRLVL